MASIPTKVADRLATNLKRYQPILTNARDRDVNESDTVTIITDLLADLFGYDKYNEITKEYSIRGTWCDLAVEIEGQAQLLIEVKAVGIELKPQHTKQAIDYAANKGVEWVVLTNGVIWQIYRVIFAKPIDQELVAELNVLDLSAKNASHIEQLFLISREGWVKSSLNAFYTQRQATNKFAIAAALLSEPVLDAIRRELRRLTPDVRIQNSEIEEMLTKEVLKREVVEGEKADAARRKVEKTQAVRLRASRQKKESAPTTEAEVLATHPEPPFVVPPPEGDTATVTPPTRDETDLREKAPAALDSDIEATE